MLPAAAATQVSDGKKDNIHPFGYALLSVKFQTVANEEVTRVDINDRKSQEEESNTYTVSEALKTPTSGNYIPERRRHLYRTFHEYASAAERVGTHQTDRRLLSVAGQGDRLHGRGVQHHLVYAQKYVEDVLIPNWEQMIDNLLTVVDDPQDP